MRRHQIISSTLLSAGYDLDTETLELEFTSGEIYQYFDVPPAYYTDLIRATSHGGYFNKYIKDQYLFQKIT